jgi:hypothetical protein
MANLENEHDPNVKEQQEGKEERHETHEHGDHEVVLIVQTTRGEKNIRFSKTAKIQDVIEAAIKEFGFAHGDQFQLVLGSNPSEILAPDRTLVSYHLIDGTIVILTAIGSGV